MKKAYLVRHAESTSNAGAPIQDFASIPLSDKGQEQATAFAELAPPADKIIVSPFLRSAQTAAPLARRRKVTPLVWAVQECMYMDATAFTGTTQKDWKPYVDKYWFGASPDYRDSPDTESYRDFTKRAFRLGRELAASPWDTSIIVTHSMFMTVIVWNILNRWPEPTQQSMWDFRAFELTYKPENLCVLPILEAAEPQDGWLVGGVRHPLAGRTE